MSKNLSGFLLVSSFLAACRKVHNGQMVEGDHSMVFAIVVDTIVGVWVRDCVLIETGLTNC